MAPFEALPAGFLTTLRQFPATASLPCQFLTSGKTTRSLICPTTLTARETRSLHSPVQRASCTAVEALLAQRPMFPMCPMFPSQACWNQLLSINLPAFLRLFWRRPARSPVPVYACPHDLLHNMHIQGKQHRRNIDQSW